MNTSILSDFHRRHRRSSSCLAPPSTPLAGHLRSVPLGQVRFHFDHFEYFRCAWYFITLSIYTLPASRWGTSSPRWPATSPRSSTSTKFVTSSPTRMSALANSCSGRLWNKYRFSCNCRFKYFLFHQKVNIEFRRHSEAGVVAWLDQHFPPSPIATWARRQPAWNLKLPTRHRPAWNYQHFFSSHWRTSSLDLGVIPGHCFYFCEYLRNRTTLQSSLAMS